MLCIAEHLQCAKADLVPVIRWCRRQISFESVHCVMICSLLKGCGARCLSSDSSSLQTFRPTKLKTCPTDEPHCCLPSMPRSFFTFRQPSFCSICVFLFQCFIFQSFALCVSRSPSHCPPQRLLLNKCISHMVELIHRSFCSVPYGAPARPSEGLCHCVTNTTGFKVICLGFLLAKQSSLLQ